MLRLFLLLDVMLSVWALPSWGAMAEHERAASSAKQLAAANAELGEDIARLAEDIVAFRRSAACREHVVRDVLGYVGPHDRTLVLGKRPP